MSPLTWPGKIWRGHKKVIQVQNKTWALSCLLLVHTVEAFEEPVQVIGLKPAHPSLQHNLLKTPICHEPLCCEIINSTPLWLSVCLGE